MRQLLLSTAVLAAALGLGAAQAQDAPAQPTPAPATQENAPAATAAPTIAPPEGYVNSDAVLTTDNLQGATVYDAAGDDIGEVHGLVFADGSTSLGEADAAAPAATDATSATTPTPATTPDPAMTSDPATGATGSESTGMAGAGTSDVAKDNDSTNLASGTDTGDNDRIENVGSDSSTVTPTDATTPPAQEAAGSTPAGGTSVEISHAIIDVGGFLGMGEHRVAVPVDDLVAYSKDDDLRIYLPWTREQLEALPEFDEDGPAPVSQ